MPANTLTPAQLRALLVTLLAGATGSSEAKWRKALGPVEQINLTFHPRSNWWIQPSGAREDWRAIEKAVAVVREAHPYISWKPLGTAARRTRLQRLRPFSRSAAGTHPEVIMGELTDKVAAAGNKLAGSVKEAVGEATDKPDGVCGRGAVASGGAARGGADLRQLRDTARGDAAGKLRLAVLTADDRR